MWTVYAQSKKAPSAEGCSHSKDSSGLRLSRGDTASLKAGTWPEGVRPSGDISKRKLLWGYRDTGTGLGSPGKVFRSIPNEAGWGSQWFLACLLHVAIFSELQPQRTLFTAGRTLTLQLAGSEVSSGHFKMQEEPPAPACAERTAGALQYGA